MIIDTSAILAVLFGEPDAGRYERAIAGALHCRMSVANFLETAIVLESRSGAPVEMSLTYSWTGLRSNLFRSRPAMRRPRAGPGAGSAGGTRV